MRTRARRSRAVFSASGRGTPFTFTGASMMFWSAVMCGNRLNDWNTMPTSVRRRARLTPGPVIDSPCTRRSPFWIGSRRFTHRISVLFPEPEGPQTTMTSPASTSRVTSASTWSGPNHLSTCLNSMARVTIPTAALLDHHEGVAGVDRLTDLDSDVHDLAGHRRLEHLAGRRGLAAAGADDVPRFLLDADAVGLAVHRDDGDPVLVTHVGHVGRVTDQERPDARGVLARVHVGHRVTDDDAVVPVRPRHLDRNGLAAQLRLEPHQPLPPGRIAWRHALGRDGAAAGGGLPARS